MKTIKGPAIFLAQFAGDDAPFNSLDAIAAWASGLGYKGVQIPSWDGRLFDLKRAAESKTYCEEVKGTLARHGLEITELSTHLQGQLVAVHPAYDEGFDGFAAPEVRGNPARRQQWAVQQMLYAAKASENLGLTAHATFSGALAWPYLYSWPPRPAGLIESAFDELAKRWRPILDAFDASGVDVCYEIHPGEDLHDGVTYEMFLDRVNQHKRACLLYDPSHFVLQQLDYLDYIDIYHDRIKIFHVKDAEFNPTVRRVPVVGEPRGALPLAGRRAGELPGHLLEDGGVRLPRLGGARMGVLPEAPGRRRARRGQLHRRAHHPRGRPCLRRLRGERRRPGQEPQDPGPRLKEPR
jgi:sugar phosphate isomerase/epimerase